MAGNALYYPYIHIRDVNWLKGTLLLFPQVRRMVPVNFTPSDGPAIRPFLRSGDRPPLLRPVNLSSERAHAAQRALAAKLKQDANDPDFVRAFGCAAARRGLASSELGFQIHQNKLEPRLREALGSARLAWKPKYRESYDHRAEYIEVHPRVGQAIMSTLAIACALGEGLDIVGDQRSAQLHRCLIEKDPRAVYDAWLHPDPTPGKPAATTAEELFEFMVGFACDLTRLTPARLASMHEDREPIRKLVERLRKRAASIPDMDRGPERKQYFKDTASKVLAEWRQDRANMSKFWRTFFGEGLVDTGAEFLEKVVAGAGGGTAGAAVAGTTLAALATPALVGAGAGLAIGIVVHAGKSYARIRKGERESHYRYLTTMESAGVVFRSDLGTV